MDPKLERARKNKDALDKEFYGCLERSKIHRYYWQRFKELADEAFKARVKELEESERIMSKIKKIRLDIRELEKRR